MISAISKRSPYKDIFSFPQLPYQHIDMKITCCSALVLWCFATAAICRPAQPQILPLGSGVHLDAGTCDSKPDWSASNFLREDCYNSVLDVFLQDYRPHPQAKFNFYSGLYPPPPGSNKIQTPRRYTTSMLLFHSLLFDRELYI